MEGELVLELWVLIGLSRRIRSVAIGQASKAISDGLMVNQSIKAMGDGSMVDQSIKGVLAGISYIYICRASPTTWNIVFNLLFNIDLILGTKHILSYTRPA